MSTPTNLIPTKITQLPEYVGSSTLGYMPYVIDGRTFKVQFSNIAAVGAVPSSRTIATGTGLTGGGDLSQDRTIAIASGGVGQTQLSLTGVVAGTYGSGSAVPVVTVDATGRITSATTTPFSISGYVPDTRSVLAGTGLTGGGPLSSDVTLSVSFSSSTPEPLGTATAGVSPVASREDHVHPAVDLSDADQTQGALPLGRGGTGDALSPIAGAVVYSDATHFVLSAVGTPGQVLTSDGANAPYWGTITGAGTVTSVDASGGTTGLTFSGGPITASGTLTLGGTLAVASGGTGATTASVARTNLGAAASGANSDITSLSGITGAIGTPTYIQFDSGAGTTLAAGRLWYDQITGSLNMGMGGGNITQQIGEELFVYGKASAAITEGQVIIKTGAVGASGVITFAPAPLNTTDSQAIIGVATENIPLNGFGRVTAFGVVHGINTTGAAYGETWADGDTLYYNPNYVGGLTKVKPSAPNQKTEVGIVINAGSGGSGSIQVEIIHGTVLGGTDSNVQLTSPADNDLLQYSSSLGYWRNLAASSVSVGTATNLAGGAANRIAYQTGAGATSFIAAPTVANTYLEWSGSAFQWSANPLGTVTSVDASGGTTGLTFTGGPITSSGTLTLGGTLGVANGGTGTSTAFTAGSVVFAGTSGVYTQDNANLFWDDTNNRLGIGIATPAYQVDVYSTSAAAFALRGDAGATLVLDRAGANANAGAFTSRKMRGTLAAPSAVASGDFSLNLSAQVYGGSNFRSSVAVRGNVETYTSDTDISSYLTFWTVPAGGTTLTERVRITGAGDVGIGTSSPSYKLDVNGTARASNAILSSIPTSDPSVTGQLWNSGGVAAVSGSTPGLWDFWTEVQASGSSMAPWTVASISSGTATGTAVPAATMKGYNPFGALVRSSTTANSGARFSTTSFPVYFGVSAQKFRAQLTPATAFTNNTIRVGFLDTTTSADATDGAYFEMASTGVVSAKTAAAGTRTTSGTTYTLTINTPYTFDVEVNAAGTSARFRIYAETNTTPVYDQSITTNIPTTTGNATGSGIVATNSGTTASDICVVHSLAQGTPTGFNRVRG